MEYWCIHPGYKVELIFNIMMAGILFSIILTRELRRNDKSTNSMWEKYFYS